jgi:hypothetical protein
MRESRPARLASLFGIVLVVEFNDYWFEILFNLVDVCVNVTEDYDLVADSALSRSRSIETKLTRSGFARDHVSLKTLTIIHIANHHLLVWKYADHIHDFSVNGDASLISEIRFGDGCKVDLRS